MTSSQGPYGGNEERVLVLLPESRDAESIPRVLKVIGVTSMICSTQGELCAEIQKGVGIVIIEEEALSPRVGTCLQATLENQPSWSELPIVILLEHGPETHVAQDALLLPGEVILVERPVRVNTLISIVRSALGSRRRQYLVRDQLQALEQSEIRYRSLFNSIDEGFCTIEMIFDEKDRPIDYLFLEINPAFATQTGMQDAKGKRMRELAPLEEHWFDIYGGVALTGQSIRFSERAEALNRWFDVFAFRIGRPEERHVAVLFSDITERKQTEEEIEKLYADLAERATELENVNQELEAFNYTVAHDLRKPLTVVNGYCQAIRELCGDKLDSECTGYLQETYNGTLRMNRLIDTLLKFSQLAHAEPKIERLELYPICEEIASELRQAEPERQVTFRLASGLFAEADPNLLRVVLSNLFGNAWKYTSNREEAVIEFGATEVDGKRAYFVRDNGMGFDSAEADKLFAPFQRLRSDKDIEGLGIGLATVASIIKRHGGKVWAEGEPGKGATFYFTLAKSEFH